MNDLLHWMMRPGRLVKFYRDRGQYCVSIEDENSSFQYGQWVGYDLQELEQNIRESISTGYFVP